MTTGSWTDALFRAAIRLGYPFARVWWHLRRPSIQGAHVILRTRPPDLSEDQILVVRNSYKPGISAPCGRLKRGERPIDGALRELFEEVGIRLEPERLLDGGQIFLIQDGRRDHSHFFECRLEGGKHPTLKIDHREVVWAGFVRESKLLGLNLTPPLRRYLEGSESAGRRTTSPRANTHSGSAN